MAITEINEFLKILPAVKKAPFQYLWSSYDEEADVLTFTSYPLLGESAWNSRAKEKAAGSGI